MTSEINCPNKQHTWNTCGHCDARRNSLARYVSEGIISTATPRPDADTLSHVVNGCFGCGGPEDARFTFTGIFYLLEEGDYEDSWLCQPCLRAILDALPDRKDIALLYRDLDHTDLLARNPELRKTYINGEMRRTGDYPAGFVLAETVTSIKQ